MLSCQVPHTGFAVHLEGEFVAYVKKFKAGYRALPRKSRLRIIFVDDKGGRQG